MQIRSIHVSSGPAEGRSRSSRYVGPGCNGRCGVRRDLPPDEIAAAYGEVVWSWRRDRGVYFAGGYPVDNGDKKRRSPGRARSKPLNIAWGKPGCLGCTCSRCPCASHMGCPCALAHGIYGRRQRPAFPASSHHERNNELARLGRIRAAGMSTYVSTSLAVELSNPASFANEKLDCFVAVAPRNDGGRHPRIHPTRERPSGIKSSATMRQPSGSRRHLARYFPKTSPCFHRPVHLPASAAVAPSTSIETGSLTYVRKSGSAKRSSNARAIAAAPSKKSPLLPMILASSCRMARAPSISCRASAALDCSRRRLIVISSLLSFCVGMA